MALHKQEPQEPLDFDRINAGSPAAGDVLRLGVTSTSFELVSVEVGGYATCALL